MAFLLHLCPWSDNGCYSVLCPLCWTAEVLLPWHTRVKIHTLIAIDTLTFVALLVCLGASWLDDASVMNLTFIGTLRTVLERVCDLGLGLVLIKAGGNVNQAETTTGASPLYMASKK